LCLTSDLAISMFPDVEKCDIYGQL
jgi:hypothetical protein